MTDSERRLKAFEAECEDLRLDVQFSDGSSYTMRGIDVKAFQIRSDSLGMAYFQLLEVVKKETDRYWGMKKLPSKTGDKTFEEYRKSNTYPQVGKIEAKADVFPIVLYHKFIRTPRLTLIMNAMGGKVIVIGDGDIATETPNGMEVYPEEMLKKANRKTSHLKDFQ